MTIRKGEAWGVHAPLPADGIVVHDDTELHALYPSHEDYVDRFSNATRDAVKDGWVQPYDAANAVAQVQGSAVPATTYVP